MTHLRKMMLDELQRRNYAQSTEKAYVRIIREFANHFQKPPNKLSPAIFLAPPNQSRLMDRRQSIPSWSQRVGLTPIPLPPPRHRLRSNAPIESGPQPHRSYTRTIPAGPLPMESKRYTGSILAGAYFPGADFPFPIGLETQRM
ncbi:MAG: phage integrase N-terminal SAM-like domain-containing protein [Acidobacteria bacterium]|nr:phage integrase N-terminal SAM-like domain-containing protein [Acidobacteriota bacterium]